MVGECCYPLKNSEVFLQMLSSENSSDPSCSSKASSDLACAHGDDQAHPSNFSIRDYVLKSRSKDIRINWPFCEQQLQLCLDNGIENILPPLETPSLVRARCFERILENGEPKESVVVNLYNQDLVPSSTKVSSERMASSNVCPVCKTFSSSSNTTLNAHIDQCLSLDKPDATDVGNGFSKPKARPRKKRLMVDIYETAPRCTLEDLDRRNGTNWAASLNLMVAPAPTNGTNLDIKRKKVSVLDAGSEVNEMSLGCKRKKFSTLDAVSEGNVGDIYVDSNGTKLLILSKFDDSNLSVTRKNFKLPKHGKGVKAGPSCEISKKKILMKPNCSRIMENIPANRKLIMAKGFDLEEADHDTEEESITQAHQNEQESVSQLLDAIDQVKNSEPSTLRHWVCSKRSDLSRKLNGDIINKGLATSKKISFRCTQTDTGPSSIERTCASDLPSLSEAMAAPKTKKIISPQPSNLKSKLLLEGDSLANSRMPKLSSSDESRHPSLKARKSLVPAKNAFPGRKCISLKGMEVNNHEIMILRKKFKKQRSILRCSKWREGEKNSDVDGGSHAYNEDFNLVSAGAKETSEGHRSNFSNKQEKDTNLNSTHEEHAASAYGNEIHAELLDQRSTYIQEEQCVDTISNDVRIASDQDEQTVHPRESPTDTGDGDMRLENIQENTSATSVILKSTQDHNIIVDMGSSGSAVSTTTSVDDKIEDAIKAKPSPNSRRPSCSCSESLSRETQFSSLNRKNMIPNLFIKPQSTLSSSLGFHSLESPTDSVVTMDSPKSAANISQPHPASSPILRLMGKDLVVSKQEPMSSEPKLISFGIPQNAGFTSHRNPYQIQAMGNHQIPIQTLQIPDNNLNSPSHYSMGRTRPIFPSYRATDVIVIDDDSHGLEPQPRTNSTAVPQQYVQSSNMLGPQRLFACFPPQNPYASRVFATNGSFIYPSRPPLYFSPSWR